MEFLNPLALVALAAAAIPLIIHLFNFRRPRKVDFSSLEFVRELQKTTMQRVRIKQLLLLVLRILAIACLVLAFARPTLRGDVAGTVGGRPLSAVAVVVDNSLSMTLRDADGEYLRQARDIASGVIEEIAADEEVYVIPSAGPDWSSPRYSSAGSAIAAIEEIEPSTGRGSIPSAVARAARALSESTLPNRELFVITDLQESALVDSVRDAVGEDVHTYLIPVGDRGHPNIAVTDVRVDSRIVEAGQPVRLSATLVNHDSDPVEGYVASVFLEGERVAQATADLPPNVPVTVNFTATPQHRGWLAGTVQIEDDDFPFDNERSFTLHVPEDRRVLVVRGEGQSAEFVQLVLSPELGRGRVAFDLTTIEETGLAAAGLEQYDAVVLVGLGSLSSGEIAAVQRYVAAGGGVLITPSSGVDAAEYNALLEALGAGRFSGFSGSLGSGRSIAGFEQVDLQHPLFEGVFRRHDLREDRRIESPEIYYAMNYSPSSASEQTLIEMSNGFPFLQEIRHENGIVFLLAVAPSESWSDLPVRGLFVPLLYRSMYYHSASESITGEQLTAATDSELRIPRVAETEQLRLVGPDGVEYVPEQRSLFGALLLEIDGEAIAAPGVYDVEAGERLVRRIAVNLDQAESDLEMLSDRQGRERLSELIASEVDLIDVDGGRPADVLDALARDRTGVEIWNLFLLLALGFLVAEIFVARRWRPETVAA